MSGRSIVLAGFMGTGKSTVGRLVAQSMSRPFLDTDEEISRRFSRSVARIFEDFGEEAFRAAEAKLCGEISSLGGFVVATGGGFLANRANFEALSASAFLICLHASLGALRERLGNDRSRPLLAGNWEALWHRRQKTYLSIAHRIDTTGKTPETVAREVVKLWQDASP